MAMCGKWIVTLKNLMAPRTSHPLLAPVSKAAL